MIWFLIPLVCSIATGSCHPMFQHAEPLAFHTPQACEAFAEEAMQEGTNYRCLEGREL